MYRAVIIYCLIAVGYAVTVTPIYYENRATRQVQPAPPTPPVPSASVNYTNNTQHVYPTYPEYVQNKEPSVPATVEKSYFSSIKPYIHSFVSYGVRTGNYLLQILGAAVLGTSLFSMICSYTPICEAIGFNQITELARAYGASSDNVDEITSMVIKAIEKYSLKP